MSDQQHDNQPADEATEAKRGNGRAKWILIALVVVAAVVGGWWYIDYQNNGKFFEETNDATVQADMVTIAPKVSGYVEEVLVRDNQDVTAGQPLVRIDPRDTRARAAQA